MYGVKAYGALGALFALAFAIKGIGAETLIIRGCGTRVLLLLHIVLCIGPLCRLDRRRRSVVRA
jgi:hypothetical protein